MYESTMQGVRGRSLQICNHHCLADKADTVIVRSKPYTSAAVSRSLPTLGDCDVCCVGDKCPKGEVSCGGDFPECISHLFVCDGPVDCHNGRDEDEDVCDCQYCSVLTHSSHIGLPTVGEL